jgi:glycerol-3-phosphate dehydrogenase (NAD(P)+)
MSAAASEKIAVLGGGTWGATLAAHLANKGHDISVWEFVPEVAEFLKKNRHLKTLPDLKLPATVTVTNSIAEALKGRKIILCVTPSHTVRSTFENAVKSGGLENGSLIICASKGLENETNVRMSEVISNVFTKAGDIVTLSGPSHAEEVALGQPVALVAASTSAAAAKQVSEIFNTETFRVYTSSDPVGVELGGALKNVYAVASGIVDGLKLGDNTKAALMSRGLLEMTRLGNALGAKTVTFFGLSGLGDMIVTCGSKHSRNRRLGEMIGQGKTLIDALAAMTMVAEGVNALKSAAALAAKKKIDMPIVQEMSRVLFENKPPRQSIKDLMARQAGVEMEGVTL